MMPFAMYRSQSCYIDVAASSAAMARCHAWLLTVVSKDNLGGGFHLLWLFLDLVAACT
jgi:hypothetical protein